MKHDAHAAPPGKLRELFKQWQKFSPETVSSMPDVLDTACLETDDRVSRVSIDDAHQNVINESFEHFAAGGSHTKLRRQVCCFEVKALPGLFLYPSLLPVDVQVVLLDKLLHRDLSNPNHNTNLHLHYELAMHQGRDESSQRSFFELHTQLKLQPKDVAVHKAISMQQVLQKKLRWVTLGGQYDWTNKVYPDKKPPPFPADIADLIRGPFRDIGPQAAILNFYSPGDTLSLHRDVSEECDQGLVSISIGCDALFMVANNDGTSVETIRLRSGDAILMSSESRYAWHSVPKVLADTCPKPLQDWPSIQKDSPFAQWRGWLAKKRINLNVRQMQREPFPTAKDAP